MYSSENRRKKSPELKSSWLSRALLCWFDHEAWRLSGKDISMDEIYELNEGFTTTSLIPVWDKHWNPLMAEYRNKRKSAQANEYIPPPSIIWCLFGIFKWEFLLATITKLLGDTVQLAQPYFLSQLITFVADPNASLWKGLMYAVLIFLVSELRSLFQNNYIFISNTKIGVRMLSMLSAAVYRKTLHLSPVARREKSVGEIINLMAYDLNKFYLVLPQLQQYWSCPYQIILLLLYLYWTIGYSALLGVLVMAVFIPINVYFSKFLKKWQTELSQLKDKRTSLVSEMLNGIKVIKLFTWEKPMEEQINKIREEELEMAKKLTTVKQISEAFNNASPFLVALLSFATFTLSSPEHELTPQIAFVSLSLFTQLRQPMNMIVYLMNVGIQFTVANKRTKEFLVAEELDIIDGKKHNDDASEAIQMLSVTASWDSDELQPTLKDIDLFVPKGTLYAIVGKVGAGKSSLLAAILGEMGAVQGKIEVNGSKAYVSQTSWIQNMTVRDNILFGKAYDKEFYDQVVHACALRPDLKILPQGDLTEIGEKGINLSGGQKARIALARAVYQDSDIYLLDDPLSAVDAHVGRHIYDKVIGPNGLVKAKTRLLVTHGLSHVKEADEILVMNDGKIAESGKYANLVEMKGIFHKFVDEYESKHTSEAGEEESASEDENDYVSEDLMELKKFVRRSLSSQISEQDRNPMEDDKLIKKEEVFKGSVKWRMYKAYVKAASVGLCLLFVAGMALHEIVEVARNYWLSAWSEEQHTLTNSSSSIEREAMPLSWNLGVYAILGLVEALILSSSSLLRVSAGLSASRNLHHPLIKSIMRLPMSFFDTTPQGRILSRCSKDMDTIDNLSQVFQYFFQSVMQLIATLTIIAYSTPMFRIAFVPLILGYYWILKFYVPIMRQLYRLLSLSISPINSHLGQSIQGASTIRAFDKVDDFRLQNAYLHDQFVRCRYQCIISNRWLAMRLEFIGTLIIFLAALFGVISKGLDWPISAGVVGMSISYALNITDTMNYIVREVSDIQSGMVAVERVVEYSEIPIEDSGNHKLQKPPRNWPSTGDVSFRSYSARYRDKLELVLNNVSADIKHGEKVGIVGRTGAGKSSFTLALFRMIEVAEGKILIDGVDIANVELQDLRGALTIIPQDPVLFSGSLRFNLDPFDKSSDKEINETIRLAHLSTVVDTVGGLYKNITEGGENISVGQRQLVCLARAILRRSRILILDEATAAVDVTTDALIQATIREQFRDSTVLTIAHRLNTVLDYDRILVLEHGRVIEFDSPANLISDKSSEFSKMLEQSKSKQINK